MSLGIATDRPFCTPDAVAEFVVAIVHADPDEPETHWLEWKGPLPLYSSVTEDDDHFEITWAVSNLLAGKAATLGHPCTREAAAAVGENDSRESSATG
ncbi:MAG TPA: hypothetical protein VJ777_08295 [Mycobacterium sp.]|nr:hypothetical protein [Mycobacterium sp.]